MNLSQKRPNQQPFTHIKVNRLLALLGGILLLVSMSCGGEISVSFPGCENCSERCLEQKGRGKCVACLVDKDCRSDEKSTKRCTTKNTCVCGSDKDCSKGERCDGENGCVQCVANKDCPEKDRPVCVGKRCQQCHPSDERACSGEGIEACRKGTQKCRGNGSWGSCENAVVCAPGEKCVESQCIPDCPKAPCALDEARCASPGQQMPGTFRTCVKDARGCLSWGELKTCGTKEYCEKGKCTPFKCVNACKMNEKRCEGKGTFALCAKDSLGCLQWSDKRSCGTTGKVCSNGNCVCPDKKKDCSGTCQECCDSKDCSGGRTCQRGACVCPTGQTLCNDKCVVLQTDLQNCGKCAQKCQSGLFCSTGVCKKSCSPPLSVCGNVCVNLQTDPKNCNTCGSVCPNGKGCKGGVCVCPSGKKDCNGICQECCNTNDCSGGQLCNKGVCFCPTGQKLCQGKCIDPKTSLDHCGTCNNKCGSGSRCHSGLCCPSGQSNCNGKCVDTGLECQELRKVWTALRLRAEL